ncbi:hypothetical protein [Roseibium sp. RKSG952]|uniref:hypothetical protein n=1 Tax=Roseibium sp. RKSG952 TaxID=2529384 RepID=UPI0012BBE9E6|nr:hypothetical protein [Roseibium sp. RKSG952]MTH95103.1 hypothetical protein [Roseibium sp. RKSG952]
MTSALHNQSPEQLADRLGYLDGITKSAKAEADEIKAELKQREVNVARGANFVVSLSTSTSSRLDTKALAADLGEDMLADYYRPSVSTRVTIKPVTAKLEGTQ